MKIIAHLSDLHFGTEDTRLAESLLVDLGRLHPSVVAISGDFTQRARPREFTAARSFLERIKSPLVVVPGNHDVPLDNLMQRMFMPLSRYCRYITRELTPFLMDEEVAILGLNSARSNTWKNGRISRTQMAQIRSAFSGVSSSVFKVVVTHHPFMPPPDNPLQSLVGRGFEALQTMERCGVDLVLAGHLHRGYSGDLRAHHLHIQRSILVVQAGTAISQRRRLEPNAYNVIRVDPPQVSIVVRAWTGDQFAPASTTEYVKQNDEWRRALAPGQG